VKRIAAISLLATTLLSGCSYVQNRGIDFLDIVSWEVGYPAFGVHAEATPILNTGLDVWLAGESYGGGTAGTFSERHPETAQFLAYSVLFFHARGVDADPVPDDVDPEEYALSEEAITNVPHAGTITHVFELDKSFQDACPENLRVIRWLDVEASAAFLLGLRLRVSPGQLLDFVLSIFGADLAGDDA